MKTGKSFDTSSREYVEWMSEVWRMNDERNKRIKDNEIQKQLMNDIAEIADVWDDGEKS